MTDDQALVDRMGAAWEAFSAAMREAGEAGLQTQFTLANEEVSPGVSQQRFGWTVFRPYAPAPRKLDS